MLDHSTLYLGDNGRCYCGEHAGATAQATGLDLSGAPVSPLTQAIVDQYAADLEECRGVGEVRFACERPGCERVIVPQPHADDREVVEPCPLCGRDARVVLQNGRPENDCDCTDEAAPALPPAYLASLSADERRELRADLDRRLERLERSAGEAMNVAERSWHESEAPAIRAEIAALDSFEEL